MGYRVTEKLFANISETEATGRTDNVDATMTIDGTTVKDVTVTADLRDLTSDNNFRDGRIQQRGPRVGRVPRGQVRAHRADHARRPRPPRARR